MSGLVRCRFNGSATCRSNTDNSVTGIFCAVDLLSCFFVNLIELRMHMMICNLIYLYRTECSKSYMKCHSRNVNAFFFYLF